MILRDEIVRFNNDPTAQHLKSYYNEKTYPEILGVSRRELSQSSFLLWILDPKGSHGIGDFGVRRLLEILMTSKFWQARGDRQSLFDNLITGNFQLAASSVQKEVSIGNAGRLDILVELIFTIEDKAWPVRLIVENKVQNALSSIASSGKDRSQISISYSGSIIAQFQKSDIGYRTVLLLESEGLIDDEVFAWLMADNSCGFPLLKIKEDVREKEAQYGRYRIKLEPEFVYRGTGYYIARNWGIGNIENLIAKVESRFPAIKYSKEAKK